MKVLPTYPAATATLSESMTDAIQEICSRFIEEVRLSWTSNLFNVRGAVLFLQKQLRAHSHVVAHVCLFSACDQQAAAYKMPALDLIEEHGSRNSGNDAQIEGGQGAWFCAAGLQPTALPPHIPLPSHALPRLPPPPRPPHASSLMEVSMHQGNS